MTDPQEDLYNASSIRQPDLHERFFLKRTYSTCTCGQADGLWCAQQPCLVLAIPQEHLYLARGEGRSCIVWRGACSEQGICW